MPSKDDDLMECDHAFDAMMDHVRARDTTPLPGVGFVRTLEGRLKGSAGARRPALNQRALGALAYPGRGAGGATPVPSRGVGSWTNAMAACLIVIALVGGGLGARRLGGGTTPSAETIEAVSARTSPVPMGTPASGVDGATGATTTCLADPRPAGSVAAMIAATTWRVPRAFPVGGSGQGPVLDGDYYTGGRGQLDDTGVIGEIETVLADLWACRMYAMSSTGSQDADSRYFAHFSDNALRRVYGDVADGAGSALYALQPYSMISYQAPPKVSRAFDVERYDPGVERVGVVLTQPPPCSTTSSRPQTVQIMIFAFEGRWIIDEVATATFDDLGTSPTVGHTQDHTDLAILDRGGEAADGGGRIGGAASCTTTYFADEDVHVWVHNPGTVAHSIRFPTLGIYEIVEPNTSKLVVVNAPSSSLEFRKLDVMQENETILEEAGPEIAEVEFLVYEAGSTEPIGTGSLGFVPQGAPRPQG